MSNFRRILIVSFLALIILSLTYLVFKNNKEDYSLMYKENIELTRDKIIEIKRNLRDENNPIKAMSKLILSVNSKKKLSFTCSMYNIFSYDLMSKANQRSLINIESWLDMRVGLKDVNLFYEVYKHKKNNEDIYIVINYE